MARAYRRLPIVSAPPSGLRCPYRRAGSHVTCRAGGVGVGCRVRAGDLVEHAPQERAGVVGLAERIEIASRTPTYRGCATRRGRPGRAATSPSASVSDSTVRSASSRAWTGGAIRAGVGAGALSHAQRDRRRRSRRQRAPRRRRSRPPRSRRTITLSLRCTVSSAPRYRSARGGDGGDELRPAAASAARPRTRLRPRITSPPDRHRRRAEHGHQPTEPRALAHRSASATGSVTTARPRSTTHEQERPSSPGPSRRRRTGCRSRGSRRARASTGRWPRPSPPAARRHRP